MRRRTKNRVAFLAVVALFAVFVVMVVMTNRSADEPVPAPRPSPGRTSAAPVGLGAPTALSRLKLAEPVGGCPEVGCRAMFSTTATASSFRWADLNHDGCNTREEIMALTMTHTTLVDGCNVVEGDLADPYTGQDVHYTEDPPYEVQIDHIVPLAYAWRHGAAGWTWEERRAFGNDWPNLMPTSVRANAQKSDQGPGEWMPVNKAFACAYSRRFIAAAYKGAPGADPPKRLTITEADKEALQAGLATC